MSIISILNSNRWSHSPPSHLAAALVTFLLPALALTARAELNAQMKKVLDTHATLSPLPFEKVTPAVAKAAPSMTAAVKAVMTKDGKEAPPFTGTTEDIKIPTPGDEIDARVYKPAGDGPFPTILYIHGGGWVVADLDVYDSTPRALCEKAKAVVISVDYRKAPDNKFPAAHDDTWAAYQWVLENADEYGGNPEKVAVAGESAGGNMAASICLMAKQKGVQMPVHQLLIYPVLDTATNTQSYKENETTKPLSAEGMKWFFKYYFGSDADAANPRVAILRNTDLKGLPRATIINAEIDPLRDEGQTYAEKLKAAGVSATRQLYKGVTHEFFGMGAVVDEANEAMTYAVGELKKAF